VSRLPSVRRAPPSGGARCERAPLLVFRPALRIHEAKTSRLVSARVVVRLIWSVQTLDKAAMTENARWTPPAPEASLAGNSGYASATCERFTAALVNPQQAGTRTTGAAATTGHISTVDNVSRVLDHQMRRTTTLAKDQTTGFDLRRTQRRSKDRKVAPSEPADKRTRRRWSLDLRCVFTKPKPVVWACRGSSSAYLVVENPRKVVNPRNVPGGRCRTRTAGAACRTRIAGAAGATPRARSRDPAAPRAPSAGAAGRRAAPRRARRRDPRSNGRRAAPRAAWPARRPRSPRPAGRAR
jgi:hypothetical protein